MTMYNLWTLIKYEYKKLFQRKAVWIVTLTLMAMAAASVILPPFMSVVSSNSGSDDSYTAYDSYKAQQELAADLKGRPLDDELLGEMNDAYDAERESTERITAFPDSAVPYSAKYDDIDAWIDDAAYESDSPYFSVDENGIPYFTGTAAQLYDIRRADLAKRWEQEYLSDEEKEFLTSQEEHRLVPFFGTYLTSYQAGPFIYLILALLSAFGGYFVWRRWQAGGR